MTYESWMHHLVDAGHVVAVSLASEADAHAIAARAVVADIETEGVRVGAIGDRRYDVRPMIDQREHAPQVVDQAHAALRYALERGLIEVDAQAPHLVRITAPLTL